VDYLRRAGKLGERKFNAGVKLKERIATRMKVVHDMQEAKRAQMLME
jgi:hypothetical protein